MNPSQGGIIAGTEQLVTTLGIFAGGTGIIPALTPLMLDEQAGGLVAWDGIKAGTAVYVSAVTVDTSGRKQASVYKCGVLNMDALNWPDSVTTAAAKILAFAGSGISVQPLSRV